MSGIHPGLLQIGYLGLEVLLIASLLLVLFQLRSRLGMTPLYVAVGTFQYLQTVLALSVYVEVLPGLVIGPGLALFTSTLFVILVVYLQEDVASTRSLIYGLLAANLTLSLLTPLIGRHLQSPLARNPLGLPRELFEMDAWLLVLGTATLLLDAVLVIVAFEVACRILPRSNFLRIFSAMAVVLVIDSFIFVSGSFYGQPEYRSMLISSILGKLFSALIFSVVISIYGRFASRRLPSGPRSQGVFQILSFRQRYERMRQRVGRDALTGLFNRGFFDEVLPLELARSDRSGLPTSLILADLDHFKKVNDDYGHQEGDRVLRSFAEALESSLRSADVACRYGGEEFAVILPHAAGPAARQLAERIRARLDQAVRLSDPPLAGGNVTITVGVATFPSEAETAEELIGVADRRLYEGKSTGRDRVVGGR